MAIKPHPMGEKHLKPGFRPMSEPTYGKMRINRKITF